MSEQEMQRQIEFIIQQQALFTTDMQKLQEAHTQAESRISRLEGAVVTTVNLIGDLAKAQKEMSEKVTAVTQRVDKLTERMGATNEKIDGLTERIDTVITIMVERFVSDQNGDKKDKKKGK